MSVTFAGRRATTVKIPYFLAKGAGVEAAGEPVPTVLYGYGGFEIPMLPGYSATIGESFLSRGMCYAMACIRGGGEFGPSGTAPRRRRSVGARARISPPSPSTSSTRR